MKAIFKTTALTLALLGSGSAVAKPEKYNIDPTHSFVQFKASHLGFSWLLGRFNELEGVLMYDDQNIANSSVKVTVDTRSMDTNHAKRDKHLKSDDYINADKFPQAVFTSTSVEQQGDNIIVKGTLSFHGMSKPLTINAKPVGAGKSPWGDYRRGFEGTATFDRTTFGVKGKPGDATSMIELRLFIEAIK